MLDFIPFLKESTSQYDVKKKKDGILYRSDLTRLKHT